MLSAPPCLLQVNSDGLKNPRDLVVRPTRKRLYFEGIQRIDFDYGESFGRPALCTIIPKEPGQPIHFKNTDVTALYMGEDYDSFFYVAVQVAEALLRVAERDIF